AIAIGLADQTGGSNLIAFFQVDQANALGGAARFADGARVEPSNLALLADDHHFRFLRDAEHAHHLAVALRGLDVDHAFAGPRLQAVLGDGGALPVALLDNREDELFLAHDLHADDGVALFQVHAVDAVSGAPHIAHVRFREADSHALVRGEENSIPAGGELG